MGNEDLKKLSETPHTDAARKISAMDRYAGEVAFGILAENLERKCAALHKEVETLRRWRECVISALVVSHIYRAEHDSRPEEAINELLSWECATALDPSVSKQARELVARARQEALEEAAKVLPTSWLTTGTFNSNSAMYTTGMSKATSSAIHGRRFSTSNTHAIAAASTKSPTMAGMYGRRKNSWTLTRGVSAAIRSVIIAAVR